jgi:DNA-binding transcriptional regulator GbsR (MarR family)
MPKLSEKARKFVTQYGEMASHWGLNRTECQVHGLLFLSPKPLDAEEIAETLMVARSHVGNSLKQLQSWGMVKSVRVLGSRREYFETHADVWEMFRQAVHEQKRREIDPWMKILREAAAELDDGSKDGAYAKKRVSDILVFFETFTGWYEDIRKLPTPMIRRFLTLGGKVVDALGLGVKAR